jgi:hypothetical protein
MKIVCALLVLLLFTAAFYFTALAVMIWTVAGLYGGELALEAQSPFLFAVLMALLFWTIGILAVALRFRALRSEDGKPMS